MSHHRHADAIDTAAETRRREYVLAAIRGQAFIADPIGATAINALVDYVAMHYADAGFPNGATLGGLVAWAHARIREMSPP